MELNGDGFLEELLSVGRESWEANPGEMNGLFSASWGFDSYGVNPANAAAAAVALPPPIIPTSSFDCFSTSIKPDLDCSFTEFYTPFEAKFAGSDLIEDGSSYQKLEALQFPTQDGYSISLMEDEELGVKLDNNGGSSSLEFQGACKLEAAQSTEIPAFNMGLSMERKSKVKKVEGQPSKNLMAERRRRKRLNDRLSMLRSVVPKISKMDRTSILGDTIDYMKELLERINSLQEEIDVSSSELNEMSIFKDLKQNDALMRNSPKFDVERQNSYTRVGISCSAKQGLLLSTVSTLEALGLEIQQCVISCFNDFSLHATCSEDLEQRSSVSSEDIKQALFRNAGYGGRCL